MATILHKRKAADPSASDLAVGELAINTSDGGVFTKTTGGAVVQLGGAGGGGDANQNAFSNVAVSGQTTVAADTTTDTLTLAAGDTVLAQVYGNTRSNNSFKISGSGSARKNSYFYGYKLIGL